MIALSRPLLALLLGTLVLSALMVLTPDESSAGAEASLLVEVDDRSARQGAERLSWLRKPGPLPSGLSETGMTPSLPPPPAEVMTPLPAPPPTVPQPLFNYLGRMVRNGETLVFIGQGDDVEVVEVGATLSGNWRLEGVTDTGLELKYLPLNETRQLALSEN